MKNFFDLDNIYFKFLARIIDVFILNVLFIIGCIPIITIPTSFTALYYTAMRMTSGRMTHVSADYWKSYKENFKQSLVTGLIQMDVLIVLIIHYYMWSKFGTTVVAYVMQVVAAVLIILFVAATVFLYPLLAKFKQETSQLFYNSAVFGVKHILFTLLSIALYLVAVLGAYVNVFMMIIMIAFGVGLVAVIQSFWLNPLFAKYMNEEDREKEDVIDQETKLAAKEDSERSI